MRVVIVGGGNWGTALALLEAEQRPVLLWTRTEQQAEELNRTRENRTYLPGITLPERIEVGVIGSVPLNPFDIVILAVPTQHLREAVITLKPCYHQQIVIAASKGLEVAGGASLRTPSQVVQEEIPGAPLVVWGGPNIAGEIAKGLPARAILAASDMSLLVQASQNLRTSRLTFEFTRDVRGVELCSAVKGLIAIALGMVEELGLGVNFASLVLTYGLREFVALAEFLGISPATIYGIAGLGDAAASGLSPQGRNRMFGKLIAQGFSFQEAQQKVGMAVEGLFILLTLTEWEMLEIPLPLFSVIRKIVFPPLNLSPMSSSNGELSVNGKSHKEMVRDALIEAVLNYPRLPSESLLMRVERV